MPIYGFLDFLNVISDTCLDHLALSPQNSLLRGLLPISRALLEGHAHTMLRKLASLASASLLHFQSLGKKNLEITGFQKGDFGTLNILSVLK